MFVFHFKKSQVWVVMALLVLCFTVAPHSGYPHAEKDEDQVAAREDLDNEEDHDHEAAYDEDVSVGEEHFFLEETATDVENAAQTGPRCANEGEKCIDDHDCCLGKSLECKRKDRLLQGKCKVNY